ncbi:hypothetical protein FNV43_RR15535 [Rhamnella rubrinervis]|uniref:F-box domain-containing protein n=1 Tax=Rhamnella rubrinervis TaxID=2594499 RepID=A0A8K0E1Z1_9ROSA|nr:hypothetical protein FNV43_RR15535 [Rhamnella rubrinervis]
MACNCKLPLPESTDTITSVDEGGSATFSTVHPDIILTNILTRLDGPTLASAACISSQLHALSCREKLWTDICHSTWPSITTPRLRRVISTFPDGPRSFFSNSFPLLASLEPTSAVGSPANHHRPSELISAVDIYYRGELMFSKVVETETVSGWFRCSPFRIDLLEPKEVVPTPIPYPDGDDTCRGLADDLTLSWIMIDPTGRRAMNLSSHRPVSVQRHWLSGEVHVRFASILKGDRGSSSEYVQCGIVVTCGGSGSGGMQVSEVSMLVEDMDGMHLNGGDSLVILERTLEGKKGRGRRREEEGRKRYEKYLEKKRERRERKVRTEAILDTLCAVLGVFGFGLLLFVFLCK